VFVSVDDAMKAHEISALTASLLDGAPLYSIVVHLELFPDSVPLSKHYICFVSQFLFGLFLDYQGSAGV
jgi:hypothetical protein